jgi:hypothetical protein
LANGIEEAVLVLVAATRMVLSLDAVVLRDELILRHCECVADAVGEFSGGVPAAVSENLE